MAAIYADNYEEITGKSRDEEITVGSVSITDMAETKVIDSETSLVVEETSPEDEA
jgi:hypothetical protein